MRRDDQKVGFFFLWWWWWLWIPLFIRQRVRLEFRKISEAEFDNAKGPTFSDLDQSVDPTRSHVLKTIEIADSRSFSAICNSKEERICKHCIESDIAINWLEGKKPEQELCIQCEFDKDFSN